MRRRKRQPDRDRNARRGVSAGRAGRPLVRLKRVGDHVVGYLPSHDYRGFVFGLCSPCLSYLKRRPHGLCRTILAGVQLN